MVKSKKSVRQKLRTILRSGKRKSKIRKGKSRRPKSSRRRRNPREFIDKLTDKVEEAMNELEAARWEPYNTAPAGRLEKAEANFRRLSEKLARAHNKYLY